MNKFKQTYVTTEEEALTLDVFNFGVTKINNTKYMVNVEIQEDLIEVTPIKQAALTDLQRYGILKNKFSDFEEYQGLKEKLKKEKVTKK